RPSVWTSNAVNSPVAATTWQVSVASTGLCTVADPNCRSIQGAVIAAQSGDTINVAAGAYFEHDIFINKSLAIVGADARTTIVDAQRLGGVLGLLGPFNSNTSSFDPIVVSLSNLTITQGLSPRFKNNGKDGGGIFNSVGVTLTIT